MPEIEAFFEGLLRFARRRCVQTEPLLASRTLTPPGAFTKVASSHTLPGADVFQLGLVQSDTDFTVYAYEWGVPGRTWAATTHTRAYTHTQKTRKIAKEVP